MYLESHFKALADIDLPEIRDPLQLAEFQRRIAGVPYLGFYGFNGLHFFFFTKFPESPDKPGRSRKPHL
jgi:hypothetical protein